MQAEGDDGVLFRAATGSEAFVATPPFVVGVGGWVYDANGDRVIVCNDDPGYGCDLYYAQSKVDAEPWYICPRCGRLGQRMKEVSPQHAGLPPIPPTS